MGALGANPQVPAFCEVYQEALAHIKASGKTPIVVLTKEEKRVLKKPCSASIRKSNHRSARTRWKPSTRRPVSTRTSRKHWFRTMFVNSADHYKPSRGKTKH
jgi:hypothetical protein